MLTSLGFSLSNRGISCKFLCGWKVSMGIISMAHANFLVLDVFLAYLRSGAWGTNLLYLRKKSLVFAEKPIFRSLQTMSGKISGYKSMATLASNGPGPRPPAGAFPGTASQPPGAPPTHNRSSPSTYARFRSIAGFLLIPPTISSSTSQS